MKGCYWSTCTEIFRVEVSVGSVEEHPLPVGIYAWRYLQRAAEYLRLRIPEAGDLGSISRSATNVLNSLCRVAFVAIETPPFHKKAFHQNNSDQL